MCMIIFLKKLSRLIKDIDFEKKMLNFSINSFTLNLLTKKFHLKIKLKFNKVL